MKIALLGYGRMGKAIEAIAKQRGHSIVIATSDEGGYDITQADVAIDFSVPNAAFFNIANCLKHGVPVVSGTTGWLHNYDKAVALCEEENGGFIYASNFSLGVNIFFELNRTLARLMGPLDEYKVSMEEIHHTQKLDAPSGTAISLAEGIIKEHQNYSEWVLDQESPNAVPITAKRIENVPGTHTVTYSSKTDTIEMTHTAHSRDGFALGAVIAAEWLVGKKGVFTMKDVLNIG
ncbi:4-hydroxy-tetrahydrodipicolinate reductase [Mangrovimonas sp. AS39]|uniref:4-hydroxy-tetrahydrodipicolinate reductase n=1 Tax=Mangrovimonas futianensis TaxID=2895523 RepID=UPI001E462533|nr:4-hydroxy-tetrahydrodipicolinate reductase [Mangrovimonas futianensis]MCF1192115.1 4-hydroxy-tetrahydrodipicolinate reductase [Mangrovimonas futianensis]MCF1195809.1 4-hydroxy-tetrahydrodipicolinate reductase [Mangrovimonas futianensis]